MSEQLSFFQRLTLAWRVLADAALATRVRAAAVAETPAQLPSAALRDKTVEKVVERVVEKHDSTSGALHLLSILQREGRLLDFLLEDIAGAGDADVGAGARVVHTGCKNALQQYFSFAPVKTEAEGSAVVVERGFDPALVRLAGKVNGEPPYRGRLAHAGWKATDVRLPERMGAHDARIVAPAEVEL